MEAIKFLKYILSRIGIMIVLTLFSAFAGIVLIPALVTVFPSSTSAFKSFMTNSNVDSFIGFAVMLIFFLRLFYDDGKRHAAYENWSWVNITIVYLLMLLVYFIPAIFRDSFSQEGKGDIFYKVLYYPCIWLNEGVGMNYLVSVILGIGLLLAASYCFYLIAYK
ncbi:hypothetical protein, partial [Ruminococcus sp.]